MLDRVEQVEELAHAGVGTFADDGFIDAGLGFVADEIEELAWVFAADAFVERDGVLLDAVEDLFDFGFGDA